MDVFTKEKRSEIMARVKNKNTRPEILVRSSLHKLGFRFTLNNKKLDGNPDIVLPRHKKIIFVNGCFWHGHKYCPKGQLPETNIEFWKTKITNNSKRDIDNIHNLETKGWKVFTIWECETKNTETLIRILINFMRS